MISERNENELTKKEDKELVYIVQKQYNDFRMGGHWKCSKCSRKVYYKRIYNVNNGSVVLNTRCTKCNSKMENFIPKNENDFFSPEFNELLRRYDGQIKRDCYNFKLEDYEDMYGDISHRFFIAVMTYNGKASFYTYFSDLKNKRFEDFERKHSRACRSASVQCQLCGKWVGAITRNHLMLNKNDELDGFVGHAFLHNKIIEDYGKDKFDILYDEFNKEINSEHWEGNSYNRVQRKIMKTNVVKYYKEMFPSANISIMDISISEKDPNTELEYADSLRCYRTSTNNISGNYLESKNSTFFIIDTLPTDIDYICSDYSNEIGEYLYAQYKDSSRVKKFKHFSNKKEYIDMLKYVFSLLTMGYNVSDIETICAEKNYNIREVRFWLKEIKSFKDSLNIK